MRMSGTRLKSKFASKSSMCGHAFLVPPTRAPHFSRFLPPLLSAALLGTSLAPGGCASLPPAGLAPWRPAQRGPVNLALCNGTCCQQPRCTSADLIAARLIALCLKSSKSTAPRQRDPTAEHGQRGGPCPAATALGRDLSGARARSCTPAAPRHAFEMAPRWRPRIITAPCCLHACTSTAFSKRSRQPSLPLPCPLHRSLSHLPITCMHVCAAAARRPSPSVPVALRWWRGVQRQRAC